ncbi:hypothetical protein KSP35_14555 [Aquihabitans sp. G128]|uniref:hypothetical protein n=1 Tax=Aquihabitans sp. G128 TaxID=2849779 RepID=UPI001C248B5E|nr:hypothetical protein [Aquihabitans sp. G128]QXC59602.1 hypothetical protein KSP35_14555 [Aquihabitans sp. G128]
MSTTLRARAEVVRLARLLGTEPAELDHLADALPPEAIRELRDRCVEVLFDAGSERLRGAASAAALLPTPVAASLAQKAMGPVLCALLAGSVDRRRTVDIADRLPPAFLAEVAIHLDPRRVPDVVAAMAPARVAAVTEELTARSEHVTMAQFVDHLTPEALDAALAVVDDDALLRTAFLVDDPARIDRIVTELPDERVVGLLAAARTSALWFEVLAVIDELGPRAKGRLADLAVDADRQVIEELAAYAQAEGLWASVLPLVGSISPDRRGRVAKLPTFHKAAVIDAIVLAAAESDRWADLLPLVAELPAKAQRRVAASVARLDADLVQDAVAAATRAGLIDDLALVLGAMEEPDHDEVVGAAVRRTARDRTWADLLPLLAVLPPRTRRRVAEQAAALTDGDLVALVRSVDAAGLWEPWLEVIAELGHPTQERLRGPMAKLSKRALRTLDHQVDGLGLRGRLGPLHDLLDGDR